MDYKLLKIAVINSLLVLVYVTVVTTIMQVIENRANPEDNFFGPVAFLMLFVLSAAVVGSLIFVRPAMIYLSGGKKEGVQLLAYTIACLLVLTIIVLILIAVL
ncbi:MAG: hypothetical protein HY395_02075 [Candidatus Doudnabacteria bacterium]|nr:hypothetical protein [Candidatus Doudnabacteria bacterium]